MYMYVVINQQGKYYKSGKHSKWRDTISEATFYTTPGPAQAQARWWVTHFPEHGIPDVLEIPLDEGKATYVDISKSIIEGLTKLRYELSTHPNKHLTPANSDGIITIDALLESIRHRYSNN